MSGHRKCIFVVVVVVVSGLQAVCHVRIMRRLSSNLEQWTIQRPRLWVPSPYSLSLTRRSKPAFQWHGTNERIHRKWQQGTKRTQDIHGGAPIHIWVFSYLPCYRRNRVLFRTARRNYYPAAWEFATARESKHYNLPFRKFLRLSKPRFWTGDPKNEKYPSISHGPLAHAGITIIMNY